KDLRVLDHRPLTSALAMGEVLPIFIFDPYFFAPDKTSQMPHRIQFLLDSVHELKSKLNGLGSDLVCLHGKSFNRLQEVVEMWQADQVVASRWIERFGRKRDESIADRLTVPFQLFEGETLVPPGSVLTGSRTPFRVFTPFYRTFLRQFTLEPPLPQPNRLPPLSPELQRLDEGIPTLSDVGLDRNPRVIQGGEDAAWQRLNEFIDGPAAVYSKGRNRLDRAGTSRISADLKFGLLSPLQVWWAMENAEERPRDAGSFLRQLVWREFSHHTLWHQPHLLEKPFRPDFEGFPWLDDPGGWDAWVTGQTGYPVVDASARQLLAEGFVPNRARMISASFLTKHLGIDYRRGEAHYLRYLVDGDWAQNNLGWQWSAGCGCDAQPYFRVFNPILQGQKFDPAGTWVRQWVPELAELPKRWIHEPWNAPEKVLTAAGVELGATYPEPVVEHRFARQRFLATAKAHLSKA
ncbi:MAG: deoxyribodipyrimidine photo-lyase, partial [Myxococcota bacterium]|nr:deoxyribodipyrimidine photo-lyase [Myxococcota bacterium]